MMKDLEAKALAGDGEAQALLHFLRLLRRKEYQEARAYAEGFPEGLRDRLLAGLSLLEEAPERLEDPLFAAEREVVLGVKAVGEGRREEAEARFQKALSLDPEHHRALTNLANLYQERGELEAALDLYQRALKLAPEDPLVHENLAALYKRKGDLDKMVAHMKRATRLKMRPPPPLDPATGRPQRRLRIPLWVWIFLLAAFLYFFVLQRP
ncbi:tetratricopeptide repeat protein [Thermus tengchongensis]|uniref:Tetratricopeptide repeat protein n=1 Tax=Thermus tengchongensis TaxID=1214928 RepID=A0A4Y9FC98_9DEIN|nr:tetratricopeptide repeat protein [Thermus tengchongensis]TFU26113.1 tetratricopeptide repeat protein [Thermus tengchongensis]